MRTRAVQLSHRAGRHIPQEYVLHVCVDVRDECPADALGGRVDDCDAEQPCGTSDGERPTSLWVSDGESASGQLVWQGRDGTGRWRLTSRAKELRTVTLRRSPGPEDQTAPPFIPERELTITASLRLRNPDEAIPPPVCEGDPKGQAHAQ